MQGRKQKGGKLGASDAYLELSLVLLVLDQELAVHGLLARHIEPVNHLPVEHDQVAVHQQRRPHDGGHHGEREEDDERSNGDEGGQGPGDEEAQDYHQHPGGQPEESVWGLMGGIRVRVRL